MTHTPGPDKRECCLCDGANAPSTLYEISEKTGDPVYACRVCLHETYGLAWREVTP